MKWNIDIAAKTIVTLSLIFVAVLACIPEPARRPAKPVVTELCNHQWGSWGEIGTADSGLLYQAKHCQVCGEATIRWVLFEQ